MRNIQDSIVWSLKLRIPLNPEKNSIKLKFGQMIRDYVLCIESSKKCPMIPPTRNPIFRNGGISGPYNEFLRSSQILVQTNPDANVQCNGFLRCCLLTSQEYMS